MNFTLIRWNYPRLVTKVDSRLSISTYRSVGAQSEHRGIDLDGRALHAEMKHARLSVEENGRSDAGERPDEKNDGAVPRMHMDMDSYQDDDGG